MGKTWVHFPMVTLSLSQPPRDLSWFSPWESSGISKDKTYGNLAPSFRPKIVGRRVSCSHTGLHPASSKLSKLIFKCSHWFIAQWFLIQVSRSWLWFSGVACLSDSLPVVCLMISVFREVPAKSSIFKLGFVFFFLVGEKGNPTHSMLHSMSNSLDVKSSFHLWVEENNQND